MILTRMVPLLLLLGLIASACRIKQEKDPTGPGSHVSQVIRFNNITTNIPVLIRIPDAYHEFELEVGDSRTVEVHSEQQATVFFVEIIHNRPGQDLSSAPRWTGFVEVGKTVTIRQRITIQPEVHD